MKRKDPKRSRPRELITNGGAINWAPVADAIYEVIDWALDIGAALTREYEEELAAVENVRRFVCAQREGRVARLALDDLLFTITVIVGAIERDLGGDGGASAPPTPPPRRNAARVPTIRIPIHLAA